MSDVDEYTKKHYLKFDNGTTIKVYTRPEVEFTEVHQRRNAIVVLNAETNDYYLP